MQHWIKLICIIFNFFYIIATNSIDVSSEPKDVVQNVDAGVLPIDLFKTLKNRLSYRQCTFGIGKIKKEQIILYGIKDVFEFGK